MVLGESAYDPSLIAGIAQGERPERESARDGRTEVQPARADGRAALKARKPTGKPSQEQEGHRWPSWLSPLLQSVCQAGPAGVDAIVVAGGHGGSCAKSRGRGESQFSAGATARCLIGARRATDIYARPATTTIALWGAVGHATWQAPQPGQRWGSTWTVSTYSFSENT